MRTTITFLLVALAFNTPVLGDEETCVEGGGAAAIRACQAALSGGSTRRSVYLALGRRLERSGKHADAVAVYRRGLRAHPGDAALQSRLKLAQSNLDEQAFLSKRSGSSAGTAPSAEAKARFKVNEIRCKTLNGNQALAACESALSVRPGDAALRRRHAELARSVGGPSVADARNEARSAQDAEEAARQASERERQRALIANIQDRLTRLGFDPGPVDGLPGSRTRNAVDAFASVPGVESPGRELDQDLSDALDEAMRADQKARVLMTDAETSLGEGNLPAARDAMSKALELAPWSDALRASGQRLSGRMAEMDDSRRRIAAALELTDRAHTARAGGDLSASLALIERAVELTPEDADLDELRRSVAAELTQLRQVQELEREAERRREEADRLFAAVSDAIAEGDLEGAEAGIRAGIELAPDDGRFEERRRAVRARRDELAAELAQREQEHARVQAEREQELAEDRARRERADAQAVLRERSRHLAKVEAEIATRELSAKLEAQQVLERLWSDPGAAPD